MRNEDRKNYEPVVSFASSPQHGPGELECLEIPRKYSDTDSMLSNNSEAVQVEYFAHEKKIKQRLLLYFVRNRRSSLRIRLFNVFIKLLSCLLYVLRIYLEDFSLYQHRNGTSSWNTTDENDNLKVNEDQFLAGTKGKIHYHMLWHVDRPLYLYIIQVIVAFISVNETVLVMYISYKGNLLQLLFNKSFLIELLASVPLVISAFISYFSGCVSKSSQVFDKTACSMWFPIFLNCWSAKQALEDMLNDLHRAMQKNQSAMTRQIMILTSTLACLIFTGTCSIEHLQRAGRQPMSLFQSFYFIIVTFSTVGYGEFYPDYWLSQFVIILLIGITFMVLPTQLEQLAYTVLERQRSGGEYTKQRANSEKHVVLCIPVLSAELLMDFLNEFYAHPRLQDFFVLLLSPCDLDGPMRMLLQVPLWADRVIYIKGSALRDFDLDRARMAEAEACFILACRNQGDKTSADQHTILRSWAVKDFAPKVPQYVQIFRPENKIHVKHAEYLVCEDEFKYAILANNCICPGISTFITLLLHTSRGQEGQHSTEPWHKLYGKHSGNEIYHIKLGQSKFFGEFEGKSFTYTSFHAHRKYGISLIGIQKDRHGSTIQLNPGPRHTMKGSDTCYYLSITKEELSAFVSPSPTHHRDRLASTIAGIGSVALEVQHARPQTASQVMDGKPDVRSWLKKKHGSEKIKQMEEEDTTMLEVIPVGRKPSIASVPDCLEHLKAPTSPDSGTSEEDEICKICGLECVEEEYVKGFPPVTPYIGTSATLCYLRQEKSPLCCLQLAQICEHCTYRNAKEYDWRSPAIILVADHASSGLYNFVIPLRAHYRLAHDLHPIVFLLEQKPDSAFLDAISWFPMIYWMTGRIECLDNLLRAGITLADHVIAVNKEWSTNEDEYMADCNTVVTVQTMYKMFPSVHFITELCHSTNMRFMQFNAKDLYALHQSKYEKKERVRGSNMAYMFRLPFAAGNVFSANMLDTLLYQAFVKDYLVQFVRLLLGIDQALGSGYLTSIKLTEDDMWIRTYGRLYQKLCASDADVPLGIYRTQRMDDSSAVSTQVSMELEEDKEREEEKDPWERKFSGKYLVSERHEISNLVRCRMDNLGLPSEDYAYSSDKRGTISFVIINPGFDLKLEPGDVIYLLKPSLRTSGNPGRGRRRGRTPSPRRALRRSYKAPKVAVTSEEEGSASPSPRRPRDLSSPANGGVGVRFSDNIETPRSIPSLTVTSSSPSSVRSPKGFEAEKRMMDKDNSPEPSDSGMVV